MDDDDEDNADQYQRHRRRQAERAREQSTESRDIGPIPKIKNRSRREKCRLDLRRYLLTYFPESFPLPFSDDHERILREIEQRALEGSLKAIAMPRGSGKTTILLRAMMWVLAYAHRRFGVLVEADKEAAEESLDTIKTEWETNDLLLADFPEIAYPIRCLEGITQRGNAQTSQGKRTLLGWTARELIFPTVAGSIASGATIRVAGILGRIRGMCRTDAAGKTIRPDFVLVNDPQTDTSALSEAECAKREKVIGGAILGLGGPGKRIAGFAAVTVIREGDASDRMLNRKLMPKWHGDRCRLVYEWPTHGEHWKRYLEIRDDEVAAGDDDHPKATAYYRSHRRAMDAGSKVMWPARHAPHELSAIQHAVNLRHDNPDTFDAEYQNQPRSTAVAVDGIRCLTSDEFCLRTSTTHKRAECPDWVDHVMLGVDCQGSSLWWVVAGVGAEFQGLVLDYGVWPEQRGLDYLTLSDIEVSMVRATGMRSETDAMLAGLHRLRDERLAIEYVRDDGSMMRVQTMLVDAGYRDQVVYKFAQAHPNIVPTHGKGITARTRPWSMERARRGERMGFGWRIPPTKGTRTPRYCSIDTNTWKTTLAELFATEGEGPGAWHLFRASPQRHRMIADNLSAEYPTKTSGHGRELYEWSARPGRDNHLLDATLLCAVGASMAGVKVPGESTRTARTRRTIRMSDARPGRGASAAPEPATAPISNPGDSGTAPVPARRERMTMAERRAANLARSQAKRDD